MSKMKEWMASFLAECENWGYSGEEFDLETIQYYMDRNPDDPVKAAGEAIDDYNLDDCDPGDMDGDHASAFTSIGWGVDEDYE